MEIEPSDIAPVAKRLTISAAGSTSSSGIALRRIDPELEQAAQRHVAAALVVDDLRVFLVGVELVRARAVLQLGDRVGRPHVLLAARAPGVLAAGVQHLGQHRVVAEGGAVHAQRLLRDLEHADAADLADAVPRKYLPTTLAVEADGLEQLRAAVRHVRADAHLGHDLGQALAHRLDVVVDRPCRPTARPAARRAARPASRARGTGARPRRRSPPARRSDAPRAPSRSRPPGRPSCAGPRAPGAGGSPTAPAARGWRPRRGRRGGR